MKNTFVVIFFSIALVTALVANMITDKEDNNRQISMDIPYSALNNKAKIQVECLAQNILFEAGNEPIQGQLAVAMVTLKRTKSSAFPDDVCGVVRQKINNVCQFSWWCDFNLQQKAILKKYSPLEYDRLKHIRKIAMDAYINYDDIDDPSKGALFYHAVYVNPKWNLHKVTKIGNHIFYKRS